MNVSNCLKYNAIIQIKMVSCECIYIQYVDVNLKAIAPNTGNLIPFIMNSISMMLIIVGMYVKDYYKNTYAKIKVNKVIPSITTNVIGRFHTPSAMNLNDKGYIDINDKYNYDDIFLILIYLYNQHRLTNLEVRVII